MKRIFFVLSVFLVVKVFAACLVPQGMEDRTQDFQMTLSSNTLIELEDGEYHFYTNVASVLEGFQVSNHTNPQKRFVFVDLSGCTNVYIRGKNAHLVFHGPGIGLLLRETCNVHIEGVSIDWARPILSEATIEGFTKGGTILKIDEKFFPCHYEDGPDVFKRLILDGEGWSSPPHGGMLYDRMTREVIAGTGDVVVPEWGRLKEGRFCIGKDYSKLGRGAKIGDRLVIRPQGRPNPACVLDHAEDTLFENVAIHSAHGMGVLAQVSKNFTWRGTGDPLLMRSGVFSAWPETRFSTLHADATHFSNMKGRVVIEKMSF